MMNKNSRVVLSIMLSLTLIIGLCGVVDVTTFAREYGSKSGLKQSVVIEDEISEDEYNEVLFKDRMNEVQEFSYSRKGSSDYWKSFSQPFYTYNDKLTANQKQ